MFSVIHLLVVDNTKFKVKLRIMFTKDPRPLLGRNYREHRCILSVSAGTQSDVVFYKERNSRPISDRCD